MKNVIAWGGNPLGQHEKKGSTKNMAKAKRSAKQKAATKKMQAANKKARGGNPSGGGKKKKGKKGKAKSHNPGEIAKLGKGLGGLVLRGVEIGGGMLLVQAVFQNVVPMSYRDGGNLDAALKAGVGVALGMIFERVKQLRRFASAVSAGGVALAVNQVVGPIVLPPLARNLLGETYYLGELDNRSIRAVKATLGELDNRTARVGGVAAQQASARSRANAVSRAHSEPN